MPKPKKHPQSAAATEWLIDANIKNSQECFTFPFDVNQIVFAGKGRTPNWMACLFANGSSPSNDFGAVRTCKTLGCINPKHFRWGSQREITEYRIFPSRSGGDNPNAKVSEEEVAQLKSVNWGQGYAKSQVCDVLGISPQTLVQILHGERWRHVKAISSNGDEF